MTPHEYAAAIATLITVAAFLAGRHGRELLDRWRDRASWRRRRQSRVDAELRELHARVDDIDLRLHEPARIGAGRCTQFSGQHDWRSITGAPGVGYVQCFWCSAVRRAEGLDGKAGQ